MDDNELLLTIAWGGCVIWTIISIVLLVTGHLQIA